MAYSSVSNTPRAGKPIIAPSVLSADFSKLGSELRAVLTAGCSWIHLDIMDNHFVPNLTFGPPVVKALRKVSKRAYFDAHLMVEQPESMIDAFAAAGVQLLTVHQEACGESLPQVLQSIRNTGMRTGVSIKPKTPVSVLDELLPEIDLVLIMTVEPGFGGQTLIPSCVNKIRTLRKAKDKKGHRYIIQVDGGINEQTVGLVAAAGAEVMVAGSAVFGNDGPAANIAGLQKIIKSALASHG